MTGHTSTNVRDRAFAVLHVVAALALIGAVVAGMSHRNTVGLALLAVSATAVAAIFLLLSVRPRSRRPSTRPTTTR